MEAKDMKDLTERPVCFIEGCDNPALVYVGKSFVCGDCIVRLKNKEEEELIEKITEAKRQEDGKNELC